VESNQLHAEAALRLELVDEILEMDDAIAQSEVIILAIPVDAAVKLLPALLNKITNQIVIDVGSTKSELIEKVKQHEKRGRYVSTHPMWGTEYSGPTAAVRGAFENKAVIICNAAESDTDALQWVKYFYQKIGMHLIEMEAKAHDLHAAYISHISHITSFALANTVLEKEKKRMQYLNLPQPVLKAQCVWQKAVRICGRPFFYRIKTNVLMY
jgi:prephenate dehydrogenase